MQINGSKIGDKSAPVRSVALALLATKTCDDQKMIRKNTEPTTADVAPITKKKAKGCDARLAGTQIGMRKFPAN